MSTAVWWRHVSPKAAASFKEYRRNLV
jgi:hypothetical protein